MPDEKVEKEDEVFQLVSFNVGEEEYGVEILKVQEIIRMTPITKLPEAPSFVEGIINLRGNVIPIVDLRKRIGLEAAPKDKDTRIIVVEVEGTTLGAVVDSVSEVLRLTKDQIEPPPAIIAGIKKEYLKGVGKIGDKLLILLDLDRILTTDEQIAIRDLA